MQPWLHVYHNTNHHDHRSVWPVVTMYSSWPNTYVADGEENKNAAGLGIKKIRVLRRRGTGPVRVLFFDDAESGRRLRINRHVDQQSRFSSTGASLRDFKVTDVQSFSTENWFTHVQKYALVRFLICSFWIKSTLIENCEMYICQVPEKLVLAPRYYDTIITWRPYETLLNFMELPRNSFSANMIF